MKSFKELLLAFIFILFFSGIAPLKNKFTLSKDYIVNIHGTSNLKKWDEKVGSVSGTGLVSWNSDGTFNLEEINIKMEVNSIKSDMGATMNNHTFKALKGDENPQIIFALSTPVKSIPMKSGEFITAKGNLTIAGVTKLIDIKVKIIISEKKKLAFEGSKIINMTQYGIDPPTALFGTLKTGDIITLDFKTIFTSEPD